MQVQLDIIKQGLKNHVVRFAGPGARGIYIPAWKEISATLGAQDVDSMTYGANSQHELYTHLKKAYDGVNDLRNRKLDLLQMYQDRLSQQKRTALEQKMQTDTEGLNEILRKIYGSAAPYIPVTTTHSLLMGL